MDQDYKITDIEFCIDRNIIKGLKSVFEKDTRFVYNDNYKETGVIITTDYPDDIGRVNGIPHIILSSVNYMTNMQQTFGYNYAGDMAWKNMKNGANKHFFICPYSAVLICSGDKDVSKDLANRLHWYLSFGATDYFSEKLGLHLQSVSKGVTAPSRQYPTKVFDSTIQISGNFTWISAKGPEEGDVLFDIDKPVRRIKLKF